MKMRLLTIIIAATCFSQAASAETETSGELTTGKITNQTTATADVVFNQPITLVNTLTPRTGLIAGKDVGDLILADGKLKIAEAGAEARFAVLAANDQRSAFTTYATGHENDTDKKGYELQYIVLPKDGQAGDTWDVLTTSEGLYAVQKKASHEFTYMVASKEGSTPKAGHYIVTVTGAVYNP